MKYCILILTTIALFFCSSSFSQSISNVEAVQTNKSLTISYDLTGKEGLANFAVTLFVSTDGGTNWEKITTDVTGAIGEKIKPGKGKSINWNVLANRDKLQGDNIVFKVTAYYAEEITVADLNSLIGNVQKASNTLTEKKVLISTSFGDIKIRLYNETPLHRDNFIKLAKDGYLSGTLFHRVIKDFMIQGGDPESKNAVSGQILGNGGPTYNIPAEFVSQYYHKKGAIAAARLSDSQNPKKESSGSQFYIVQGQKYPDALLNAFEQNLNIKFTEEQRNAYKNIGGAPHLDGSYTVFGEVIEGLDVIDKIAHVAVDGNNRPLKDIIMTVKVVE